MSGEYIIETRGLSKAFAGFHAVRDVNLRISRHSVHAIIGPNGAGKTTCFNLLTRFLDPSAGTIFYKGRNVTHMRPAQLARQGVVRSFQISAIFPHLSLRENVRLALQSKRGRSYDFWRGEGILRSLDAPALALLESVGLAELAETPAVELPYGRKRALEIATTLALDPEVLLLDEPTAGMSHEDVERVAHLIQRVAVNRTILMVEHNLGVVARLAQRITVLARGQVLAEGDYETVSRDPRVMEAYMGTTHG